jgi:hypothetical protein
MLTLAINIDLMPPEHCEQCNRLELNRPFGIQEQVCHDGSMSRFPKSGYRLEG